MDRKILFIFCQVSIIIKLLIENKLNSIIDTSIINGLKKLYRLKEKWRIDRVSEYLKFN